MDKNNLYKRETSIFGGRGEAFKSQLSEMDRWNALQQRTSHAGMDRWKLRAKLAAFPYFRYEAFLAYHVVLEKYMLYNL